MTKVQAHRIGRVVTAFLSGEVPEVKDLELTADPVTVNSWSHEEMKVYGQFCKQDSDDVTLEALITTDGEVLLWRSEYPNMHTFVEIESSDEFVEAIQ